MKTPKLIELLKSLTIEELERFKLYLCSPFFNNKPQIVKLFLILKKYYPEFNSKEYSKENIFKQLCPKKQFNNLLLNEYYSLLSGFLVDFLEYLAFKKQRIRSKIDLLNEFRSRGLLKDFKKLVACIKRELAVNKFDFSVLHSYLHLYIAIINFKTEIEHTNKVTDVNEIFEDYKTYLIHLINLFVSEYISAKINFYNDHATFQFKEDNLFTSHEIERNVLELYNITRGNNPYEVILNLNFTYLEILEDADNLSKYYTYKKLVFDNQELLQNDEFELHLNFLKTYCIDKCYGHTNRDEFSNEYVELELYILKEKLFQGTKTKNLQNIAFRNVLLFLANKGDTDKITELIEYSIFLNSQFREDYKNFAQAYLYYLNGQFTDAEKSLTLVKINDKQIQLDLNLLLLKIFFDIRDFKHGMGRILSIRRTINNNEKINNDRKERYKIFLNYYEKLFKRLEKKDEAGLYVVFQEIRQQKNLLFSEWFNSKFLELFRVNHSNKQEKI